MRTRSSLLHKNVYQVTGKPSNKMSFGYFKPKQRPNYPLRARRSVLESKQRRSTMKERRPSVLRSIAHREMLDLRENMKSQIIRNKVVRKNQKLQSFCDHRVFPAFQKDGAGQDMYDIQDTVVEISNRSPNLARSIARNQHLGSTGTIKVSMPETKLKLSRNDLLTSALPEIDYLLRFKRAAFSKAHCPLPTSYSRPVIDEMAPGYKAYSTSASTDVEGLRTMEQKHGRGWMPNPYQDYNPAGEPVFGSDRRSSINFRDHQPLPKDQVNFSIKSSASAANLINRKQFMNLSSFD